MPNYYFVRPVFNCYLFRSEKQPKLMLTMLIGEITNDNMVQVKKEIKKIAKAQDYNSLIINFNGLKYINSQGIGLLSRLVKHTKEHEQQLIFTNLKGQVKEVIELINFSQVAIITDNLEDTMEILL
jgi:anti-anti-sigma factor